MESKPKMIYEIHFKIKDEEQLLCKIELVKKWYNEHWFTNEEILKQQVKRLIGDHLDIDLVKVKKGNEIDNVENK